MLLRFAVVTVLSFVSSPGWTQSTNVELTSENAAAWKQHVLPAADELEWMQIPWLTTFANGIVAANKTDKPLLLWVMNGHPLGCT